MKLFFVWLVIMTDHFGQHIVVGMKAEQPCREAAANLNAGAGPHRGLHWSCERVAVER